MHATIESLRVRAVRVPMPDPHQTASGVVSESPLVLIDLVTDAGTTGHAISEISEPGGDHSQAAH